MKIKNIFGPSVMVAAIALPAVSQRPALVPPVVRFSDSNGKPLAGGFVFSFQAGTTTPLATYTDSTTGAVNPNPVVLDSTGSAPIFLGANVYKFVLEDSKGAVQWTEDNVAQGMFTATSVTSVFGRTGAVTAQNGDYSCAQVTGAICSLPTPPTLYNQTIQASGSAAVQEPVLNFIPGVSGSIYTFTASGGTGYTGAPSVTFTGGGCTVQPTGSVAVSGGAVTNPTITTAGSGCTTPPTPSFSGGGGTGATGSTTLTPNGISCVDDPAHTSTDCTFTFSTSGGTGGACVLTDQTGSRSLGAVYQNTTNSLMYISGSVNTSPGGSTGYVNILEGISSPTTRVYGDNPTATLSNGEAGFFAAILPGYFYAVQGGGAVNGIQTWVEITDCGTGGSSGPVTLTGPVTGTGTGTVATTITPTGVTAGAYTLGSQVVNVNAAGQITGIGNPFGVSFASCSACGTLEIGNATANPATFTLSYSNGTPASASIGDGTTTDTLSSPYTSGSIAAAYCTTGAGQSSTTFTVNATATNSQTANASDGVTCLPRVFGGVGTAGATGATASGTTAVLVGATGTLTSNGLGSQGSWGPYSPSNQKIYVLAVGSGCSFTSGGFAFPMNAPTHITFTNQYGASVGMYLYESANLLSVPFTLAGSC